MKTNPRWTMWGKSDDSEHHNAHSLQRNKFFPLSCATMCHNFIVLRNFLILEVVLLSDDGDILFNPRGWRSIRTIHT
jgi:hypothetical protein